MREFPTRFLYKAAGFPKIPNSIAIESYCWLCGKPMRHGVPKDQVIKPTFTDLDKCKNSSSEFVCRACAWCFSEQVEIPGRSGLQRLRNYSHFVVDNHWMVFAPNQKQKMSQILCNPPNSPWLGVISKTGQKHLIFRSKISIGCKPAIVQFEETPIRYYPGRLRDLLERIECFLRLGFSKNSIQTGEYLQDKILKVGIGVWNPIEVMIDKERGSSVFDLALFLATKGDDENGTERSSKKSGVSNPSVN